MVVFSNVQQIDISLNIYSGHQSNFTVMNVKQMNGCAFNATCTFNKKHLGVSFAVSAGIMLGQVVVWRENMLKETVSGAD